MDSSDLRQLREFVDQSGDPDPPGAGLTPGQPAEPA
jgi:hypothetical protein